MIEIKNPTTEPTYFIAFSNDNQIAHVGKLMENNWMATGQPNKEEFTDINLYISRASDFGITIYPDTGTEFSEQPLVTP